jgi:hypothetical protein
MFRVAIRVRIVLYTQTILAIVSVCGFLFYHGHCPLGTEKYFRLITSVEFLPLLWLVFECLLNINAPRARRIPSWKWFIILFSSLLLAFIIELAAGELYIRY